MSIAWIEELNKDDIPTVGGKGANLGEMIRTFPVPNAYVVATDSFNRHLEENNLKEEIFGKLSVTDVNDPGLLDISSGDIRNLIIEATMPWETEAEIISAYKKLGARYVAVRSSATAEDLPEASFAGQQDTYLNVEGERELIKAVKQCWASLYTSRAIFYREKQGFQHEDVSLAVIVQQMVESDISGVMFTSHPSTGEKTVIIEAGYGLGETIVGGKITPDTYVVDQATLDISDKKISTQKIKYVRGKKRNEELEVEAELRDKQKMPDDKIKELAKIGVRIEEHYGKPMDVEWCLENNELSIVQARPATTIKNGTKPPAPKAPETEKVSVENPASHKPDIILVKGLAASPGVGSGKVTNIKDASELDRVKDGDILVTVMTTPDMVPAMRRAKAIVTNEGGMTCHASIVSRELGIPCIVGTSNATEVLSDGMEITVDASTGVVYEGIVELEAEEEAVATVTGVAESVPVTATKILVNIGVPEKANEYARLPVRGVGLMREEFIVTSYVCKHPSALIERGESQLFIDALIDGISTVARAFYPRPVVLRTSDFKTNEYRALEGGEKYEAEEANPMIGWRGVSRYVSKEYEEAFRLELRAIKKVRDDGLKNVWVMLPFVRTVDEVKRVLEIMKEEGLERGKDLKLWIMAEVPSNIFLADQFAELCDGFSIGSNDLTQLVMGADRDSDILAKLGYFDERNDAVKRAIAHLIRAAHEKGCTVSICGQAPSVYPEFTEFLIREGIDSISLNADVVPQTIRMVASLEQRIIMDTLREIHKD